MTKLPLRLNHFNHTTLFFLIFFSIALVTRLYLRSPLLELDEAEQVILAQHLLLGYPNQPPLYSWIQYYFFQVLGINLTSLALLKCLLLSCCLYYYHLLCTLYCPNKWLALSATAAWILISSISMDLLKDNTHSILALLTACMTWYWFITPTQSPITWYLRLGLIIGLGILSKFNYLLFLILFLISIMIHKDYRLKLADLRISLSICLIFIIIFPYSQWLMDHYQVGLYTAYKLVPQQKTLFDGLINFIGASVLFIGPVLTLSYLFFPLPIVHKKTAERSLLLSYHLMCFPVLAFIVLVGGIRHFETRWLIPILCLTPLLFFSHLKPNDHLALYTKRFILFCLFIQFIFLSLLSYQSYYGHNKRQSIPIIDMANRHKTNLEQIDSLISDSHWLLGNMQLHFKSAQSYLIHRALQLPTPSGNTLMLWEGDTIPYWAHALFRQFKPNCIHWIKNKKTKEIIAGQALIASAATT